MSYLENDKIQYLFLDGFMKWPILWKITLFLSDENSYLLAVFMVWDHGLSILIYIYYMIKFSQQPSCAGTVIISILFIRWIGLLKLDNLSKLTQLLSGRVRIWHQVFGLQCSSFSFVYHLMHHGELFLNYFLTPVVSFNKNEVVLEYRWGLVGLNSCDTFGAKWWFY